MIRKVEFTYKKHALRYDSDKKKWTGWQVDVRVNGKRYRNVFAVRRNAELFVDELRKQKTYGQAGIKAPQKQEVSLRQLVDARLASRQTRKQSEFAKRVLNYFLDITGEIFVSEVTLAHLRTFVEKRSKETSLRGTIITPQTVDRELTEVAAMLHSARTYFDSLETYVPPRIPHPKYKKGERNRVITDDERDMMIDVLTVIRPDVAKIFEFASLTGLRHSEIVGLKTTDLDRKARSLKVYRPKTDSTSYISPLTDRMLELLEGSYPSGHIFSDKGHIQGPTVYKALKTAAEMCGIPYGRFTDGGIILHDNRHSFITRLQQAGVDIATIQSFSGHSDKTLVMRYSHARPESRKRAMDAIDGTATEKKLKKIYDKVASGKLSFRQFLDALK